MKRKSPLLFACRLTLVPALLWLTSCQAVTDEVTSNPFAIRMAIAATEEAQRSAAESLSKALDQLRAKYPTTPTETERRYLRLRATSAEVDNRTAQLAKRREDLANTCDAVFNEWSQESDGILDESLKEKSKAKLQSTRDSLAGILKGLDDSFAKVRSAQSELRDYTVFMKHLLSAESIEQLDEPAAIRRELEGAKAELDRSLKEVKEYLGRRSEARG